MGNEHGDFDSDPEERRGAFSDVLYYEAHITIEPVFDERLELFQTLCKTEGFKAAKLLMQKNREASPERSNKDTFCTGHGQNYDLVLGRIDRLVAKLRENGFAVWRDKIEAVLLDRKYDRGLSELSASGSTVVRVDGTPLTEKDFDAVFKRYS